MALLVEYYNELPQSGDESDAKVSVARLKKSLNAFRRKVAARYTEGTLQRLLNGPELQTRRAAILAIGLVGSMNSNAVVAELLKDDDARIRQMAADALWSIWFRADSRENNEELQRLLRMDDAEKAMAGIDRLIQRAPHFAEAYNQRAILHFRLEEYQKAVADCEAAIKLNPLHFGAQAGMAQCYMKLRKPRPALRAFRNAYRINPGMEGVAETIRALESVLGDDGRNDKK